VGLVASFNFVSPAQYCLAPVNLQCLKSPPTHHALDVVAGPVATVTIASLATAPVKATTAATNAARVSLRYVIATTEKLVKRWSVGAIEA